MRFLSRYSAFQVRLEPERLWEIKMSQKYFKGMKDTGNYETSSLFRSKT